MPRKIGERAAIPTVHACARMPARGAPDDMAPRDGGHDQLRRGKADLIQLQLDRSRAQRAGSEGVHQDSYH
jgi:hypothetical protein